MAQVAIPPPMFSWESKPLFHYFHRFELHHIRIFNSPLRNITQQQKINYLVLLLGRQAETIVANDHHMDNERDTVKTYYELFENHIRLISKFRVSRYCFYLLKQDQGKCIEEFVLQLSECLRECQFSKELQDKTLLDQVIYSNKHMDLIRKFLRKGEELTLKRSIEMICSQEAMEQLYKEIKSQGSKSKTRKIS